MNLYEYCYKKGMDEETYNNFKALIKVTAKAIRKPLEYKGGCYYNTCDIVSSRLDENIQGFIIQELKKLDIEFINDNELYRVTD